MTKVYAIGWSYLQSMAALLNSHHMFLPFSLLFFLGIENL